MMFVSYSQNFEDVMLFRALGHIKNGFYIDIGAQDPVIDSVSLAFSERGWKGVSVEPSKQYSDIFRIHRPQDLLEQVIIGDDDNTWVTLFEFTDTGLSTADRKIAQQHEKNGLAAKPIRIPSITLETLLNKYNQQDVHWLKIDVEGFENAVLRSWNQSTVRPWILVIEATKPGSPITSYEDWEPTVLIKGYDFVYFDGLNRFYIHQSHPELRASFNAPPNIFDNFSLSGSASQPFCSIPIAKKNIAIEQVKKTEASNALLTIKNCELTETLHNLQKNLENLSSKSRQQELDFHTLIYSYTALNSSYQATLNSWSWKITAPLRALFNLNKLPIILNRIIYNAINLLKLPISWLISLIFKNQKLSDVLNQFILKFPFLHQHLRAVAVDAGYLDAHLSQYVVPQHNSLTPRAARIEAKLSKLIAKHRSTADAHRH